MKEISQRDQLSHRSTNTTYMMSTGFSIDIKSSTAAERCKETRRQREGPAEGEMKQPHLPQALSKCSQTLEMKYGSNQTRGRNQAH
ncbi:hypothetical protein NQZ68_036973 [Dissostichus eleginoides]|nr:hypothetical protein NQZ68_036973 [Dissostichus eleginoides]